MDKKAEMSPGLKILLTVSIATAVILVCGAVMGSVYTCHQSSTGGYMAGLFKCRDIDIVQVCETGGRYYQLPEENDTLILD